uniref:Uncharacterized protein n=1 Tax=Arundo donax TaxID=35708 RepID=A0A0A8XQE2_ARUDO
MCGFSPLDGWIGAGESARVRWGDVVGGGEEEN